MTDRIEPVVAEAMINEALLQVPRGKYKHYKGKIYEVLGIAIHTETHEQMVVYMCIGDGVVWTRPISMFNDYLPDGQKRFTLIFEP